MPYEIAHERPIDKPHVFTMDCWCDPTMIYVKAKACYAVVHNDSGLDFEKASSIVAQRVLDDDSIPWAN